GSVLAAPGTTVMAAAAAYAGIQVRGSLREMEARLEPWTTSSALGQEKALDGASAALVSRILDRDGREQVADETIGLARGLLGRIAGAPPATGGAGTDTADDRLITDDEAAAVILGLQDRGTRDRAAEWMEGPDAEPALRLWRALSRRCVGSYAEHAAAPLSLVGWVAWSTGDEPTARAALGLALRRDPEYLFARLLHQACNENLDPETLRNCLRRERDTREAERAGVSAGSLAVERTGEAVRPAAGEGTGAPETRAAAAVSDTAQSRETPAALPHTLPGRPGAGGTAGRRVRPGTRKVRPPAGGSPVTGSPASGSPVTGPPATGRTRRPAGPRHRAAEDSRGKGDGRRDTRSER
ncbi:DUF4192 family protein, partial [Streptomyces sp. NPDC055078]